MGGGVKDDLVIQCKAFGAFLGLMLVFVAMVWVLKLHDLTSVVSGAALYLALLALLRGNK